MPVLCFERSQKRPKGGVHMKKYEIMYIVNEQTLVPLCVLRNSGSRVKRPTNTTRLIICI